MLHTKRSRLFGPHEPFIIFTQKLCIQPNREGEGQFKIRKRQVTNVTSTTQKLLLQHLHTVMVFVVKTKMQKLQFQSTCGKLESSHMILQICFSAGTDHGIQTMDLLNRSFPIEGAPDENPNKFRATFQLN